MLNTRQNFHHSSLPSLGELGTIRGLSTVNPRRRCIVESFPLCDNVLPYSVGIHTCNVRFLDNGEIRRFSGFYFEGWK